jgi:WhiB family redox-sensing transcriptional regulator
MADAACRGRGAEVFYPDRSMSHAPAKAICAECPVRPQCLEYTMERNEKHGIWAGLNERERRRLRKQRGKAA